MKMNNKDFGRKINSEEPRKNNDGRPVLSGVKKKSTKKEPNKPFPSEEKRMTTKISRDADNILKNFKDKYRMPKVETLESAVEMYELIDQYIPEYSGETKHQAIKRLLEENYK
ncbi:hypothetical protein H0243_14240 [Staphylococcus sciuri]|uniref:hypothetical protein n=2 Tax=Mammaliicoccus sciuri TaxID=1296 RepID=UPI0018CBA1AF|nr:hypothetical protein [Mammaliicoccus sciuri]MBG9206950.1 hypothetical protein [Mammaliicoccus sciuri]